jgi:hypothetical protein
VTLVQGPLYKNMNLPENIQPAALIKRQTSSVPRAGELVQVRSRRWLFDEVIDDGPHRRLLVLPLRGFSD